MKKILIFALTAAMLFCLIACGRNNDADMPAETTPQTNTANDDMPNVDKNIPDPEVNDNSTGDKDTSGNNDQDNILDDTMDQITGQK